MSLAPGAAYALIWIGFAAYLGALAAAPALRRRLLPGVAALLVLAFVVVPPVLSHDVYSYVDYARLGVLHGLNPYVHAPLAAPGDPAFAHVTWTDSVSAYGPLFTLSSYPLAWVPVSAAVWALKALAGAAVLGTAWLTARLAAHRGLEPARAAAFVALNPLVLVHVVGGGHNDGLMMLLVMAGVAALLAAQEGAAATALAAAVAVKLPAAVAAPFALLGARRPRRFLAAAAAALLLIALASGAAFGVHALEPLGLAGENQSRTSHLSIPVTFARLSGIDVGFARTAALALYAALVAWLLVWTARGGDWVRAAAWAAFGLLLATSWLLPWYLIWALPLAAVSRDAPLQAGVLALTAYQLGARIPL